jgi:hypothetical protein
MSRAQKFELWIKEDMLGKSKSWNISHGHYRKSKQKRRINKK